MKEERRKGVSCIIPAYNEEKRIGAVLAVVVKHPLIDEIIVIDDGSEDRTREIIEGYGGVKLRVHEQNLGKSMALYQGIREASMDLILLLDSDLVGLNTQNITDLISPVVENLADVSISLRRNAPKMWHRLGIDYISGERVLPRSIILPHLEKILSLLPFGFEVFLNRLIIESSCRIKIVPWPNVDSPYKINKVGILKGVKRDFFMMLDIFRTISIFGPFFQIVAMRKLKVDGITNHPKISLVICAYNEEKYIGACLEHAIKNSKGRISEILVINNASTDRTREVALGYEGVRVVEENRKGQVRARERSFYEVKGDIIAYLDADTKMPEGWIDIVTSEFLNNKNLVCLSGPYIYYDFSKR